VLDSRFAIPRRAFETGRRSRLDSEEVATTIGRGPDRAGIVTVLREHIGIEPSDPAMVLKLAAIGITNGTWRNSPLEDWHAEVASMMAGCFAPMWPRPSSSATCSPTNSARSSAVRASPSSPPRIW
jgi:hypothetical protein